MQCKHMVTHVLIKVKFGLFVYKKAATMTSYSETNKVLYIDIIL